MKRISHSQLSDSTSLNNLPARDSPKRLRLDIVGIENSPGLSVYERIFRMADRIRRSLNRVHKPHRSFSATARNANAEESIHVANTPAANRKTAATDSMTVLSSTPFPRLPDKNAFMGSERCLYQRLLSQASTEPPRDRCLHPADESPITIVIEDTDATSATGSGTLRRCSLSPIRGLTKQSVPAEERSDKGTMVTLDRNPTDEEARRWLDACEQTPYLSDQWLANLTGSYQAQAKQRARERQLAECKVRHWERQRELANQRQMSMLEQRLSCLLLTPPVLHDPYLVPQPIPIELPYQPRKVSTVAPPLPVLNESQLAQVDQILRTGSSDTVVATNFNLSVTRKEITTLAGSNWLSDMIINFYLQLLCKRSQQQQQQQQQEARSPSAQPPTKSSAIGSSLPRLVAMNTFFYSKLTTPGGPGYAGVRRWSRQMNLLDQDLVLIPIHDRGMHWCLACIDLQQKSITYYDSMGSPNDRCLQTLKSYLQNECQDKKGHPLPNPESWKLINTEDTVPQQENGSDCGVFLCTFGEFLSRRAPLTFSQSDMPGIRKRMIFEIATQQLLTTGFKL